jgi:hypothetical protein
MARPAVPTDADVLTVSALTRRVRSAIEGEFGAIWVAGEISNLARPPSGHLYLSLKDDKATLRTVIYRGVAIRVRFEPRDGMEVVARGRLTVYEPRGEYQFAVEEIHPKGIGALELALQQLRERLAAKGYFDPRRKKPLPHSPVDHAGHESERGRRPRHARTPGPPLAGRRGHDRSNAGPGGRGRHRDRDRPPGRQPAARPRIAFG